MEEIVDAYQNKIQSYNEINTLIASFRAREDGYSISLYTKL